MSYCKPSVCVVEDKSQRTKATIVDMKFGKATNNKLRTKQMIRVNNLIKEAKLVYLDMVIANF